MSIGDRHIVLFNLYSGGHHPQHMLLLAHAWSKRRPAARLSIAVPAFYKEIHPWFERELSSIASDGIDISTVDGVPSSPPRGPAQLVRRDLLHGRCARELVDRLKATHIVFMFFDHVQVSLATNLRFDTPVSLSGIYFRPSFHYAALSGYRPSLSESVTNRRKRAVLAAALRNPHLDFVFSLDPYLVEHVGPHVRGTSIVSLPDPVHFPIKRTSRKQKRSEQPRLTFLLFGILDERKGLQATLEAAALLPANLRQRIRFVLAGKMSDQERESALRRIDELRVTGVDVVLDDRYVPNDEMERLFDQADVVLTPYQKHLGSSGVLVHAAAAGRPVVGSDYGVVGENIRRHHLGVATDTTDPARLCESISEIARYGSCKEFDATSARAFANANTADSFTSTILDALLQ